MTKIVNFNHVRRDIGTTEAEHNFGHLVHEHSGEIVEMLNSRESERMVVSRALSKQHQDTCGCGQPHDLNRDTAGQTVLVGALCGLIMSHPEPEAQAQLLISTISLLAARVAPDGASALMAILAAGKEVTEMFPGPNSTAEDMVMTPGFGPRGPLGPLDIH